MEDCIAKLVGGIKLGYSVPLFNLFVGFGINLLCFHCSMSYCQDSRGSTDINPSLIDM